MIPNQATSREPMKCIWMEAGVVDYKLCDLEFDCENCPFDRSFRNLKYIHRKDAEIIGGNYGRSIGSTNNFRMRCN